MYKSLALYKYSSLKVFITYMNNKVAINLSSPENKSFLNLSFLQVQQTSWHLPKKKMRRFRMNELSTLQHEILLFKQEKKKKSKNKNFKILKLFLEINNYLGSHM